MKTRLILDLVCTDDEQGALATHQFVHKYFPGMALYTFKDDFKPFEIEVELAGGNSITTQVAHSKWVPDKGEMVLTSAPIAIGNEEDVKRALHWLFGRQWERCKEELRRL